jgi:hypothetical protein
MPTKSVKPKRLSKQRSNKRSRIGVGLFVVLSCRTDSAANTSLFSIYRGFSSTIKYQR